MFSCIDYAMHTYNRRIELSLHPISGPGVDTKATVALELVQLLCSYGYASRLLLPSRLYENHHARQDFTATGPTIFGSMNGQCTTATGNQYNIIDYSLDYNPFSLSSAGFLTGSDILTC